MKRWIVFLLLFATPALARIGETRAQCEVRYGKATQVEGNTTHHHKAGYALRCTFHEGRCDSVSMTHRKDPNGRAAPITEGERTTLLASLSGGMTWTQVGEDKDSGAVDWECPTMEAFYSGRDAHLLFVGSREFFDRRERAKGTGPSDAERDARKRLEGF
ncbi:hypothetical protein [Brevifollis gellanilyticus]|uniref:Uncharacterized protein n=1 Tax=Brevifollis gellanilyticus TaxID=748831 RepID=A0A512MCL1_9BACT|nr:hypothetical protein [Brevifollis gellanilyticus]GEP44475.1 hypothetical protein BGE01nite_37660 [Brevifollis gellanilyticus]